MHVSVQLHLRIHSAIWNVQSEYELRKNCKRARSVTQLDFLMRYFSPFIAKTFHVFLDTMGIGGDLAGTNRGTTVSLPFRRIPPADDFLGWKRREIFQNLQHEALAGHDDGVPRVVGDACGAESHDRVL